ncbi:MAG: DUF4416 family protein [Deltaproteobacteria bacterium]|nr:DUF4416 family protein [Deltaproteobacteria bacterium]
MSLPCEPDPVKLIASIFSPQEPLIHEVITELSLSYGPVDWESPPLFFDRTRYYEKEMGWPLHRRFVSFEQLIPPDDLVKIKLETNQLEEQHVFEGKRLVNIDPGYIGLERLVLATGKNYVHRIYLGKGIYGDLTLVFKKGTFRALEWTYRDYADPEMIEMFNQIRKRYTEQLKDLRKVEKE